MLTKDDEGRDLIPMWPFKAFADYCIEESMINCSSEAIDLSEFMDEFLPDIENYEILPSVFWNLEDSGVLTVKDLLRDLNNELLSYK
ncbi:DUF2750 domain-containing protein [Priestia flexa]|nr:DUF2750 domain-containing protein [Priestia flexa]MED3826031.1 DUF2750 domain-containing protein [Priestia flexa]